MNDLLFTLFAALVYPGLFTALMIGALYRFLLRRHVGLLPPTGTLRSREGLASTLGVGFAGVALALLPWPFHPTEASLAWLWAWAAFELAFLLPLLPAMLAGTPVVARAALREAQLGTLARALLWAALVPALVLHNQWAGSALVAHLLSLVAALAAFPLAIGWGPFSHEESVTPAGSAAGLSDATQQLDAWGRDVRAGTLLMALLVATLPLGALPPLVGLALLLVGLILTALLLREFAGRSPRMNLPSALRFGLLVPLPLSLGANLALLLLNVAYQQ
ncbi:hypothetical protein [Candidatus Viridilinea mediisalina]|uniref:NADH:quinone oxidoreductase/Mrp antiporter membrane subunit domain-containing protein n=1 Tax=Candidatus Viridilinea mediisalina TaxID=2024553 RepID=A0A2A6RI12_9CHLR|nr:hypothetical protein [Candidatus Viridilinea mediisalina]PDW02519.1 hypothetical protein CJ255_13455 [Candidatus Viridilinea mediisalina]